MERFNYVAALAAHTARMAWMLVDQVSPDGDPTATRLAMVAAQGLSEIADLLALTAERAGEEVTDDGA